MPIFRRKNCIHTASGIVALCKLLYSTLVESRMVCVFTQYHQGEEIKEGVMRGACSVYGGGEKRTQVFGWKKLKEKGDLEDLKVDGKAILNRILRI
jgi:hypothetical protein